MEKYEITVGVFQRGGNPFAPRYELSDPLDPTSEIIEVDAGITMPDDGIWGISVTGGFDTKRFEIDGKFLIDPQDVVHQGSIGIGTGGELFGGLNWHLQAKLIGQETDGTIEHEIGSMMSVTYPF